MNKKVKKILIALAASSLCMLVSGCSILEGVFGSGKPSDSSSSSSPSAEYSSDSEGISSSEGTGTSSSTQTPVTPVDPVEKDYTYEGHISEVMPRVSVVTDDGSSDFATVPMMDSKWDYVDCTITVSNCEEEQELSATAGIKVRGNYTVNYAKKPFRIKFDKKQTMLGLNGGAKYKSWVLLADYKDASMLRNSAAFYYGQTILGSDGYYTSDFRNVELYINGQYWGVYLLAEQQQINTDRVDINEAEENYTGTDIGYLLEYDGYYYEEDALQQFTVNYNNHATLRQYNGGTSNYWQDGFTIKSDVYSAKQRSFIASYVENLYRICYYAAYNNSAYVFNSEYTAIERTTSLTPQEAVERVLDVDSLVDMYILQEIACDYDINWSSFLMDVDMSADGDKKLVFEAPWDFDSAFGNRPVCESGTGLYAANSSNPWLLVLINQDWFRNKIKAKWQDAEKHGVFSSSLKFLKEVSQTYADYYVENYSKWNNIGASDIVGELCAGARACRTQEEAAAYLLNWLTTRLNYLNGVWGTGSSISEEGEEEVDLTGMSSYRYEAENAAITGGIAVRTGNNASGDGYLGQVAGGEGRTVTFTVTSTADTEAYLYVGLSKRESMFSFATYFSVYVNDEKVSFPTRFVAAGDSSWHDWTSVGITYIPLKAGVNTVMLRTEYSDATNLDYIDIYSSVALQ